MAAAEITDKLGLTSLRARTWVCRVGIPVLVETKANSPSTSNRPAPPRVTVSSRVLNGSRPTSRSRLLKSRARYRGSVPLVKHGSVVLHTASCRQSTSPYKLHSVVRRAFVLKTQHNNDVHDEVREVERDLAGTPFFELFGHFSDRQRGALGWNLVQFDTLSGEDYSWPYPFPRCLPGCAGEEDRIGGRTLRSSGGEGEDTELGE